MNNLPVSKTDEKRTDDILHLTRIYLNGISDPLSRS